MPCINNTMSEGDWGWFIIIGMVSIFISTTSQYGSFGLLFGDILDQLGHGTTAATLIINILSASVNFSGLLGGVLLGVWNFRTVCFLGGGLFFLGQILTILANSLSQLVLAYSIVSGIGLGLLVPSSYLALNTWWVERRGMAMGITQAAIGMGFIATPSFIYHLLSEYSFRGTMLILGGISLHSLIGASLFRPKNIKNKLLKRPVSLKQSSRPSSLFVADSGGIRIPDNHKAWDENKSQILSIYEKSNSSWRTLICDLSLVHLFVVLAISFLADANFFTILTWHLSSSGLNSSQVAMCLSVAAGTDVLGRLTWPFVSEKMNISPKTAYLIACAISAIVRSILAEIQGIVPFIIMNALVGFIKAGLVVNQALVIAARTPLDQFAEAYSLYMAISGVITILFGPLIGIIRDRTQSYKTCIHLMSGALIFCAISWILEERIIRIFHRKRQLTSHHPYQPTPC